MLFNLDLSLLEVLFIYSIKKVKNDIFSFVASLPSLQLVTSLPDSTKGAAKGHMLVKGLWAGLAVHPDRPFTPNQSLKVPGQDKRGKLVEWVEKASFDRLNRLFKIVAAERSCETLLSAQNLRSVTREPQSYVLNILPRRLPKEVVAGKHFVLQDLSFFAAVRKADARTRKARLNNLERLRTPRGSKSFGPSLSVVGRLALLAKEATSINQPGSPHLDADATEASCATTLPPSAPPTEEMGANSQGLPPCEPSPLTLVLVKGPATRRSRPARDLKSGLIGRLQDRFLETIEVNCSGSPVDDAACISASSFSYAKLEEKLKRIPPGSDVSMPSAKMFEAVETLVSGLRGMAQQHDLFSDLLRATDYTKAFISQHKNNEEKLRLRLEQAEASLFAALGDNEALRAELAEAKSREESVDARLHEAEDEMALLRWEMRQLRTEVSIEKKQRKYLQLRLSAQKEELEAEFAAEMEEHKADYQKQVDEMYFFGYHCCMKKHGIKRDVPLILSGEEEKLRGKPAQ
ncbi:hypothetical protein CK203_072891 [Vitis vinifera]|uniref:Uncharacterized protein n=1 Tax=Vitis vinifera TaxID=29760 RepID=A0A438DMD2_VITVI|nr:hypothetical protein CK203_072891 [Vitis vinifera]